MRQLLRHHARSPDSKLATLSTEFIPFPDYGGGAKYSLFEHSVACATWIREEWAKAQAETPRRSRPRCIERSHAAKGVHHAGRPEAGFHGAWVSAARRSATTPRP